MDQIDNLILNTESSEQNLKRLTAELARTEDKIAGLQSTFQAGGISFAEFDKRLEALSGHAQAVRGALGSLDSGSARTSEGFRSVNQALQTLSFTTNDATQFFVSTRAGINAISNNIPGVVNALGTLATAGFGGILTALSGPAGLILGLTTAAALVPVLTAHWGELEDAFGLGGTRTEAEEMALLAKNTEHATEAEKARLALFKEREKVGKALEGGRPEEVVKTEAAAEKVINELGRPGQSGEDILAGSLAQARNPAGVPLNQAGRERLERIEATGTSFQGPEVAAKNLETARREEQKKAEDEAVAQARRDIRGYVAGQMPGGLTGLINEVSKTPGAFPPGLAEQLQGATPEGRAAKEADKKAGKTDAQAAAKAVAEEAKRRQKQTEELNKAGEENERAGQEEQARQRDQERAARVKDLAGGAIGTELLQGKDVSAGEVEKVLKAANVEDAGKLAGKDLDAVRRSIDEDVQKRALAEGITPEEARAALAKERNAKILADLDKDEKEQADRAKKGGAGELADAAAKAGGTAPQIQQYLQSMGLPANIAARFAGEAAQGAQQDQLQAFLKPEKPRNVETFESTSAYLEKAQTAVGGGEDHGRMTVQQLTALNQKIDQLVRNTQGYGFGNGDATF